MHLFQPSCMWHFENISEMTILHRSTQTNMVESFAQQQTLCWADSGKAQEPSLLSEWCWTNYDPVYDDSTTCLNCHRLDFSHLFIALFRRIAKLHQHRATTDASRSSFTRWCESERKRKRERGKPAPTPHRELWELTMRLTTAYQAWGTQRQREIERERKKERKRES